MRQCTVTEYTFDLVSFLYRFLSRVSKDFFQSPDKKATCFVQIQRKILENSRNRELNWTFYFMFLKKKHFFTLWNNNYSFCMYFIVLKEYDTVELNSVIFFSSCPLPPTNSFFVSLKAIGAFKPCSTPLWTIGFSNVAYIKLWWSVIDLQKNALKI